MAQNYIPRRIPENVTDSGKILGFINVKNLIESIIAMAVIGIPIYLLTGSLGMIDRARAVGIPTIGVGILFILGIPPYSIGEYCTMIFKFMKTKHYAKYNPRLKWETTPDYLVHPIGVSPISELKNVFDILLNADTKDKPVVDTNITNPTHNEQFIEDEEYLEENGLTPDDLKTPRQKRAEERARKRAEKERAREEAKAKKDQAKADEKAAKKKARNDKKKTNRKARKGEAE